MGRRDGKSRLGTAARNLACLGELGPGAEMEPRPAVTAADQHRRFELIIRSDAGLMRLLTILRELALPQWRLVAGCLYQTVWNVLTGRPRGTGINDYDVIYFD